MKIVTDLIESNNLLKQYSEATAQVWMFHISHKKLAIKLSSKNTKDVVYIVVIACEHIVGSFAWNNAKLSIFKEKDKITSDNIYKIIDQESGFELISSGGFSAAKGIESEFGNSFDNFFLDHE